MLVPALNSISVGSFAADGLEYDLGSQQKSFSYLNAEAPPPLPSVPPPGTYSYEYNSHNDVDDNAEYPNQYEYEQDSAGV